MNDTPVLIGGGMYRTRLFTMRMSEAEMADAAFLAAAMQRSRSDAVRLVIRSASAALRSEQGGRTRVVENGESSHGDVAHE